MKKDNLIMLDGLYMPVAYAIATFCGIALVPIISFGNYIWAAPLIIIPFITLNIIDMVEVNFKTKMYREGISFLGFTFGEWKKIPDIQYVSIISKDMNVTTSMNPGFRPAGLNSNTFDAKYGYFQIRLFKTYKIRVKLKEVNSYKRALKFGKILAKGLNVNLLDATEQPAYFIQLKNENNEVK